MAGNHACGLPRPSQRHSNQSRYSHKLPESDSQPGNFSICLQMGLLTVSQKARMVLSHPNKLVKSIVAAYCSSTDQAPGTC